MNINDLVDYLEEQIIDLNDELEGSQLDGDNEGVYFIEGKIAQCQEILSQLQN